MTNLAFVVTDDGTIREQPPERPAGTAPRPVQNKRQEEYDAMRRPQAAALFRAMREAGLAGLSWKECWAIGAGSDGWDVGPIVVWLRKQGVQVDARYDTIVGETRFYLVGV